MSLEVIPGTAPLVLVAPHGGQRDPTRRPWDSGSLKVNDLHTASLSAELAAATGAAALINTTLDRNDIDLNRVSAAHDRAPEFLERLAATLEATLARHRRATLLTIHGWNVVQPALDAGLGCAPGTDPFAAGHDAAVSQAFAASAVRALAGECAARGIAASVGARYPARARENLLQLFTPRYVDDPRALVRRLAALGRRTEAVQLELGIPLRWPGPWRTQLVEACTAALPWLTAEASTLSAPPATPAIHATETAAIAQTVQFVGADLSGLARVDGQGGRLLIFPGDGGLVIFTGERTGGETPDHVGGLSIERAGGAGLVLRYRGPFLRYPDTTPFLDLEQGFARARIIEGDVELVLRADHTLGGDTAAEFGQVSGAAILEGARLPIEARGFVEFGAPPALWPRVRAALDLTDGRALSVTLAPDGSAVSGFLCTRGRHVPVTAARATIGAADHLRLEVEAAGGERVRVDASMVHRLPVVRQHGATTLRILFATCRLDGGSAPAGWCELAGT